MTIANDSNYQQFDPDMEVTLVIGPINIDIADPELGHENLVNGLQVAMRGNDNPEVAVDQYLHKMLDYWHQSKEISH